MALMGLAKHPSDFKLAISGAPVTAWEMYDSAYTERYMSMPDTNGSGYAKASVLNLVSRFPDESVLLSTDLA